MTPDDTEIVLLLLWVGVICGAMSCLWVLDHVIERRDARRDERECVLRRLYPATASHESAVVTAPMFTLACVVVVVAVMGAVLARGDRPHR